ncbi:antitoxin Xre/MbcA/ParS-like domain-containing protein [Variovorax atrisoli]|uniref:antitoxin Xre/MbcA/ParS-like domain-containing protein n=1 Tax=Variovorax atrisoli TaxID=3394203 RepID=UPI0016096094|nr:hypothetical protein [Variovorax sp. BK613]MBB3643731.1 hypothetical protein [Variovorax sp. BK613]
MLQLIGSPEYSMSTMDVRIFILYNLPTLPILPRGELIMGTPKQAHLAKAALTKAIESKVERLDMAGLLALAVTLDVQLPASTKAVRGRERKPVTQPSKATGKVLQGSGIGPIASAAEGSRLLRAITVDDESSDWAESDLVGAGELVDQLHISRGTLDNWRKANKIIALRKGLRNFVYPLRQFERRKPVDGLDIIAPLFTSPEETWEWLVAPNRMTGGKPPIDKLRDGDLSMVKSAAEDALGYA